VTGDGETAMAEIVLGKAFSDIPGLTWTDTDGTIRRNEARPLLPDLDLLAPPARHLRPANYRYSAAGLIPMDLLETSRGCSQYCPFCSPASLHKGKWRPHSPLYVLEEVKRLWKLGARYVMLSDDNFAGDLDRSKEIAERIIAEGIKIAFFCFLRPFQGRMDVKRAMAKAGFVMLSYGAESPNMRQLQKYGKGFDDPKSFVREVNREWHEAGARYIGNSFVFGDPDESVEDLSQLGDYARMLDPTYIEPLYSQPFPGTRYRENLEKRGLLLANGWDQFTEGRMLARHPALDEKRLLKLRVRLWLRFFSPRKIAGALRVPLYLYKEIGIYVRTVLRYMKACDYSMFGCILEDKFYFHLRPAMVREYLREHINSFEPSEREMTPFSDEFTSMVGLDPVKRLLGSRSIAIEVFDGKNLLTRFVGEFGDGRVVRLWAGLEPEAAEVRLKVRLEDVVSIVCGKNFRKAAAVFRTALYNMSGWLLFSRIRSIKRGIIRIFTSKQIPHIRSE